MLMNIFGILTAVLVLSILVAVHEAGHLLLAKWSNIRVDVFSIGMGKPIWGFQYGETFYQIGQLPFGGYCAFGDEENGDKNDPDPRAFPNSPLWARLVTVIGGSLFNIIFAYFMLVGLFSVGFQEQQLSNQVAVVPTVQLNEGGQFFPSPAALAGLQSGDVIIEIENQPVAHFFEIPTIISLSTLPEKKVMYLRNGETNITHIKTMSDQESGLDIIGVQPIRKAIVQEVISNSSADNAGIKAGDKVIAVNGKEIKFFHELSAQVDKGEALNLTILRGADQLTINVTPYKNEQLNIYQLGVLAETPEYISVSYKANSIFGAFRLAAQDLSETFHQTIFSIVKIFSGQVNVEKNLSGPVRIVAITGDIAKTFNGVLLIKFMVMLSVALAVFNLLPVPGLDGGAMILQTLRTIFHGNQTAETIIGYIEHGGILLLLALAVFVLFNDVRNLAQNSLPQKSKIENVQSHTEE